MSAWLQQQASSHRVQLGTVAIASGLAVAGSIWTVQQIQRRLAVEELKSKIPNNDHHIATVF